MSLAKKLRDVVAANFIEIARVETPPVKTVVPPVAETNPANLGTFAEADIDSFLKDISATSPSSVTYIEPEPIPEPVAPPPSTILVSLADAVSEDGDLDFARVFQQYELPTASFSAEQAMNMLQSLPRDLALRTKRVTVNTTLSAIGKVVGTTPQDIVVDAARKKETLERYMEALGHEVEETTAATDTEIEKLQAQITAHRESLRVLSRKRAAATEVCRSRMDLFDQVIHFFDYDETVLNAPEPIAVVEDVADDPDDMPAFMREDAVRRMLGINEDFTNENGEFDATKFAQVYGNGTEPAEAGSDDDPNVSGRRPRAKN